MPCPVLASYTLALALQPRKKQGKTSVRVAASKPRYSNLCPSLRFSRPKHYALLSIICATCLAYLIIHDLITWIIYGEELHVPRSEFSYLARFITFIRKEPKGMKTIIWCTAAEVKVAVVFWWTIIEAGILMFFLWKGWRLGWSKHEVKPAAFPHCINVKPLRIRPPKHQTSTALSSALLIRIQGFSNRVRLYAIC